ncbi:MAG: Glu-tRNA(Gln) amidotransferase subunit GatE [Candidatus Parvarchaeota archaeon]|nr:Glu-tRNA(Gln) amidotransferase subunit GatE [Candidatus Parvarchaeota archaeon]
MKIHCGFEWHVQLDSGKLFCRCSPVMHDEGNSNAGITRLLTPSFGESGEVDVSASFEGESNKRITYEVFSDSDCLVDIDEEPPHEVDKNALETALQMCGSLDCTVFDNIIFMRKVIVDGSNTSGFQRTALIGIGGKFSVGDKSIPVDTVSLEEDSARIASSDGKTIYKLDRLGIPLIEIATGVIDTDEKEAKEVAMTFGRLTRLFSVRRGIGTIRQDVNLSIEGGSRVELKGFQNIREMDKVIVNEATRQSSLLKLSSEKKYLLDGLDRLEGVDITNVLSDTGSDTVKKALSSGKIALGFRLPGFKGVFGTVLSDKKRFGTEVSDYLRVKCGCGIIHSDELPAYGISEDDKKKVAEKLRCSGDDAFAFSLVQPLSADRVRESVISRVKNLLIGVPSEVRTVEDDNTTRFLRPIGGKNRMYVETDLPIIKLDKRLLDSAEDYRGYNAERLMKEYNISEDKLDLLISTKKLNKSLELNRKGIPFNAIISIMVEDYRYIKRKFDYELSDEQMESVLSKIHSEEIAKDASRFIFEGLALGKVHDVDAAIKVFNLRKKSTKELESEIKKLITTGKFSRYDTLVTNLRDRLGFSFDAGEAYKIAMRLLNKK